MPIKTIFLDRDGVINKEVNYLHKIEDFKFHDLRYKSPSYLAINGATLAGIAEALGNKTLEIVKLFAHISK